MIKKLVTIYLNGEVLEFIFPQNKYDEFFENLGDISEEFIWIDLVYLKDNFGKEIFEQLFIGKKYIRKIIIGDKN